MARFHSIGLARLAVRALAEAVPFGDTAVEGRTWTPREGDVLEGTVGEWVSSRRCARRVWPAS